MVYERKFVMIETPANVRKQGIDEKESQRLALKRRLEQIRLADHQKRLQNARLQFAHNDQINQNKIRFTEDRNRKKEEQQYVHANGFSPMPHKDDPWQTKQFRSDYIQNTYLNGIANLRGGIEQRKLQELKSKEKVELEKKDANRNIIEAQNNPNYNHKANPLLKAAKAQHKQAKRIMNSKTLTPEEKKRKFDELTGRLENNDFYNYMRSKRMRVHISQQAQKPRADKLKKELTPEQRDFLTRKEQEQLRRIA